MVPTFGHLVLFNIIILFIHVYCSLFCMTCICLVVIKTMTSIHGHDSAYCAYCAYCLPVNGKI